MPRADWTSVLESDVKGRCAVVDERSESAIPLLWEGVLFNRHELAEVLAPDEPSPSDTLLVRLAYERWRDDFAGKLKGNFAVVIWDRPRRTWLAVRDAMGIYPLYYACVHGGAVFATSMEAVLDHPSVSRDLNLPALVDHLCHRWPLPGETFFSSVLRVPPGSMVCSVDGTMTVRRHWDPAPPGTPMRWLDARDIKEQFERLFNQAVDRAVGGGRTAIFLSGGLDSVSVAATAVERAKVLGHPKPRALSLGFPHVECDEREIQTEVARRLGMEFDLLPMDDAVGPEGLLHEVLQLTARSSAPILNTWSPAYARLALIGKAAGVETILTGNGGDEWLTVSPYLSADLIRAGDLGGLWRLLRAWSRSLRMSGVRIAYAGLWMFGARPLCSALLARIAPEAWHRSRKRRLLRKTSPPWVAPDAGLQRRMRDRVELALTNARPPDGFYRQVMRTALDHPLVSMELEEMFAMGRRLGLSYRHPYWDIDLVDMLARTPPDVLNFGGRSKGFVRELVEKRLAHLGFLQQRKARATKYYESILRREGVVAWRALGGLSSLASIGVVDFGKASAAIDEALRGPDGRALCRAWELINLETWVRARLHRDA